MLDPAEERVRELKDWSEEVTIMQHRGENGRKAKKKSVRKRGWKMNFNLKLI